MAKSVETDLKKAIVELQVKIVETCEKLQVIDSNIGEIKRGLELADMIQRTIKTLLPGTKAYESLGIISLFTIFEEIKGLIKNIIYFLIKRTLDFNNNIQYLEKDLKEIGDIIEIIQQLNKQTDAK